jgi:hypothetical protein
VKVWKRVVIGKKLRKSLIRWVKTFVEEIRRHYFQIHLRCIKGPFSPEWKCIRIGIKIREKVNTETWECL